MIHERRAVSVASGAVVSRLLSVVRRWCGGRADVALENLIPPLFCVGFFLCAIGFPVAVLLLVEGLAFGAVLYFNRKGGEKQ